MSKNTTISFPCDLYAKMSKYKEVFNYSKICQDAIRAEIEKYEDRQAGRQKRVDKLVGPDQEAKDFLMSLPDDQFDKTEQIIRNGLNTS